MHSRPNGICTGNHQNLSCDRSRYNCIKFRFCLRFKYLNIVAQTIINHIIFINFCYITVTGVKFSALIIVRECIFVFFHSFDASTLPQYWLICHFESFWIVWKSSTKPSLNYHCDCWQLLPLWTYRIVWNCGIQFVDDSIHGELNFSQVKARCPLAIKCVVELWNGINGCIFTLCFTVYAPGEPN